MPVTSRARLPGSTLAVGPHRYYPTVALAAAAARDGDTVEIDAGLYEDDVAIFPQDDLTIRAVGGRVRLVSRQKTAQGKAIFVIKGNNAIVEGLEFAGARVQSRNGAGIRHEGGLLTVRDCLFEDNEIGLLTGNDARSGLVVERCEFTGNAILEEYRPGDDVGHQIYVGRIGRFSMRDSYVHRGFLGHLVKSRARQSLIFYNRLTDEADGRASYELEFPEGGLALVVGNVIAQSRRTENEAVVGFGAEGYLWPVNDLYLVNNTLVDDLPGGGQFVRIRSGGRARMIALNNLLVGNGSFSGREGEATGNFRVRPHELADVKVFDVRLRAAAPAVGRAVDPGSVNGQALHPEREYVHPRQSVSLPTVVYSPGAMQSTAP